MAAISQLSFFFCARVRRVWKILQGAKWEAKCGKCFGAFYVVAHFPLAKLNDWLSVPFRMVSGSKNLNSGQPNNRQNATCNMQHVSHAAAPLNCISLPPNTSTISRLAYTKIKPEKKRQDFTICNKLATNNRTTCCIGQLLRLITETHTHTHYVNDFFGISGYCLHFSLLYFFFLLDEYLQLHKAA